MAVIIVGVFPRRDQAEFAVGRLRDRGFRADQVGLAVPGVRVAGAGASRAMAREAFRWIPTWQEITPPGAAPVQIAGLLVNCAGRTGEPSLGSQLICLGIAADHARWYELQVRRGHSLVLVRTDGRADEAEAIMRQAGSIQMPDPLTALPIRTTTPTPFPEIRPGAEVYTSDGQKIGVVQEVGPECLQVLCCTQLFVPPARVQTATTDRVVLNVPRDQLEEFSWRTCEIPRPTAYEAGGPGYSGLPPQEHEPGVPESIETTGGE